MSNNTDNGYRSNIVYSMLDADKIIEFDTIVEILNKCFGKNYKGFQRAFVVLDNKGTAFWAPKFGFNKKETRWKNTLEDGENTIIEEDSDGKIGLSDIVNSNIRVTFTCLNGKYRFLGVYKFDEKKSEPNVRIFRRIYKVIDLAPYSLEKERSNLTIEIQEAKKIPVEVLKRQAEEESHSHADRRSYEGMIYIRNSKVAAYTKIRAAGICQLCGQPAPFKDKDGEPFLENHHIVWLSGGGTDTIDNTCALCPNCHRKMHILDLQEDVDKLIRIAKGLD